MPKRPPPPPPSPSPAAILRRAGLSALATKLKAGKALSPHEWRMLSEEEARTSGASWTDRSECAKELSEALQHTIGLRQLYELKRQGAPIPVKGPIEKAALWRWIAIEKRGKGRPGSDDADLDGLKRDNLAKKNALLGIKVDAETGAKIDVVAAEGAIDAACADLRNRLRLDLPPFAIRAATTLAHDDAAEAIRSEVDRCLGALAEAKQRIAPKRSARA